VTVVEIKQEQAGPQCLGCTASQTSHPVTEPTAIMCELSLQMGLRPKSSQRLVSLTGNIQMNIRDDSTQGSRDLHSYLFFPERDKKWLAISYSLLDFLLLSLQPCPS
jgi:hypothetical protein